MLTYNLKGIRDAVYSDTDYAPENSPLAKHRVTGYINRAQLALAKEAPFLFHEQHLTLTVEPDVEPTLATDTLRCVTGDPWVLETTLVVGTTDAVVWNEYRNWAGRMLMIKDPVHSERWQVIRIREVWSDLAEARIRLTLETPWHNDTDTGLEWRIETHEYTLPPSVVNVCSLTLRRQHHNWPIKVVGQGIVENMALTQTNQATRGGIPHVAYRSTHRVLRAPTLKPATSVGQDAWAGPEPLGDFEYFYTYVWGEQEDWRTYGGPTTQTATAGSSTRYRPWVESGRSPISDPLLASTAIVVVLPNYDYAVGFNGAGTPRLHRAGVKKRIWRRRTSNTGGSPIIELPNTFFLLTEVDGHTESFTDDGSITPDYSVPYVESHGHESIRLYPGPNDYFDLNVRAIVIPYQLTDDADTPVVHEDAIDALIFKAKTYLYEAMGNTRGHLLAKGQYTEELNTVKKRHADLRPPNQLRRRGIARVRRRRGIHRQLPLSVDNAS